MASATLRSPLAFVVLALLYEAPMHPYRMGQLVKERGKERVVNIAVRNSIQQAVHRLARDRMIEVDARQHDGGYPARTVYRITEAGAELLFGWLATMLAHPVDEYPRFPAALAFLALTDPDTVTRLLAQRVDALAVRRDDLRRAVDAARPRLARILLIEDEYALAMLDAEIAWTQTIVGELRAGTLHWDTRRLVAMGGRPTNDPAPSDRRPKRAQSQGQT